MTKILEFAGRRHCFLLMFLDVRKSFSLAAARPLALGSFWESIPVAAASAVHKLFALADRFFEIKSLKSPFARPRIGGQIANVSVWIEFFFLYTFSHKFQFNFFSFQKNFKSEKKRKQIFLPAGCLAPHWASQSRSLWNRLSLPPQPP